MNTYLYVITGMSASFLLSVSLLLFYLKYKKNLLQEQYRRKEAEVLHQKELLHAVITSQEKERRRIGMDLHDDVGAALSALRLSADQQLEALPDTGFRQRFKSDIDHIVEHVRSISHDLSPLIKGPYGFYDAVHGFCDSVNRAGKIRVVPVFNDEKTSDFLDGFAALTLYRVITELIGNTIKHARAQTADIDFSLGPGSFDIDYRDDGIGMPPQAPGGHTGIGFRNMESRLGTLNASLVIEKSAKGAHIRIHIPIPIPTA